ncbi:MAG TPA: hypothetical protein VMT79_03805 [Candidatus Binatia bacterium]|nr:hypothetical protein [Candidatus Binatia bacterium]
MTSRQAFEQAVNDLDGEIRIAKREARLYGSLETKVAAQRRIRELEGERNRKRRALFEAQDEVDRKKEGLIAGVEARLHQTLTEELLFVIHWRVN